jgi:hypothetical protein
MSLTDQPMQQRSTATSAPNITSHAHHKSLTCFNSWDNPLTPLRLVHTEEITSWWQDQQRDTGLNARLRVILPTSLETYAAHYRRRATEGSVPTTPTPWKAARNSITCEGNVTCSDAGALHRGLVGGVNGPFDVRSREAQQSNCYLYRSGSAWTALRSRWAS